MYEYLYFIGGFVIAICCCFGILYYKLKDVDISFDK